MAIEVNTTARAEVTWVKHTEGNHTQELTGLSLTDVRQLVDELTEVIEFADAKPEPWGKRSARRPDTTKE